MTDEEMLKEIDKISTNGGRHNCLQSWNDIHWLLAKLREKRLTEEELLLCKKHREWLHEWRYGYRGTCYLPAPSEIEGLLDIIERLKEEE